MKRVIILLVLLGLGACAAVIEDPWSWLDDPARQNWNDVTVNGYGREIRFAVPDRLKSGGSHVIRTPSLLQGEPNQVIDISGENRFDPAFNVISFAWDHYWGGFHKDNQTFYKLAVWVEFDDDDSNLLDLDVEGRMKKIYEDHQEKYMKIRAVAKRSSASYFENLFFENFKIEPYQSAQNYLWTLENQPILVKEQEYFRIPISDQHELCFWFFYHVEDGGRDDPAWLERRRQISRKILDTVHIIPEP